MIRRVMFYLNKSKPGVYKTVECCAALCFSRGLQPCFFSEDVGELRSRFPHILEGSIVLDAPETGKIDMIFVFGGDGTVLRALDSYVDRDIPMLGVNLGRMGFLLETEPSELDAAIERIAKGEYDVEVTPGSAYKVGDPVTTAAVGLPRPPAPRLPRCWKQDRI